MSLKKACENLPEQVCLQPARAQVTDQIPVDLRSFISGHENRTGGISPICV